MHCQKNIVNFFNISEIFHEIFHAKNFMKFYINMCIYISGVGEVFIYTENYAQDLQCSGRGSSEKVGRWTRAEGEVSYGGSGGCHPVKMFENKGADLCNLMRF